MKFKKIIIIILVLILFISLIFWIVGDSQDFKSQTVQQSDIINISHVKIGEETLTVDLALTPEAQEQGLSGRTSLTEDNGMLFVFAVPAKYAFWMPNMNFPIDIIWLDQNKKIVYIKEDAEPSSYPENFKPKTDAKYVLEVISGFSEKNKLEVGDIVQFLP